MARAALRPLADQFATIGDRIAELDHQFLTRHRANPVSQRLATIPGVGPVTASALAATVADPGMFASGREFSAVLGLVPRQNSSGGKVKLGGTSKIGDRYLRHLLVSGAAALANKMARMAWALMIRGETFRLTTSAA